MRCYLVSLEYELAEPFKTIWLAWSTQSAYLQGHMPYESLMHSIDEIVIPDVMRCEHVFNRALFADVVPPNLHMIFVWCCRNSDSMTIWLLMSRMLSGLWNIVMLSWCRSLPQTKLIVNVSYSGMCQLTQTKTRIIYWERMLLVNSLLCAATL